MTHVCGTPTAPPCQASPPAPAAPERLERPEQAAQSDRHARQQEARECSADPEPYAQVMQRQRVDEALIWRLMRFPDEPEGRARGSAIETTIETTAGQRGRSGL